MTPADRLARDDVATDCYDFLMGSRTPRTRRRKMSETAARELELERAAFKAWCSSSLLGRAALMNQGLFRTFVAGWNARADVPTDDRVSHLQLAVATLQAALRRYGVHTLDCIGEDYCTCGLAALLLEAQ